MRPNDEPEAAAGHDTGPAGARLLVIEDEYAMRRGLLD